MSDVIYLPDRRRAARDDVFAHIENKIHSALRCSAQMRELAEKAKELANGIQLRGKENADGSGIGIG